MLAVRRVTIGHKIGLPLRPDLLAKVVKFAKSLHKPIEHPGLHTSCWFGSLESLKIHKMLIPSNPKTRVIVGSPANFWTHLMSGIVWNEQALLDNPASYIPPSLLPVLSKAALAL